MRNLKHPSLSLLLTSMLLASGCATKSYLKEGFKADQVGRVAVLPYLDNRPNPDPKTDFRYVSTEAKTMLFPEIKYKRRYMAFDTSDIGLVSEYSAKIIEPAKGQYATPEYIKQLGPSEAKWILIPVCEDLSSYNVVLYAGGSASVTLYLFNKETGELAWKGETTKRMDMGGLIGGIAAAVDKDGAVVASLLQCEHVALNTLPEVKNPMTKGGGNWVAKQYSIYGRPDLQKIAVTSIVDGRRRESKKIVYEPEEIQAEILKILKDKDFEGVAVSGFGDQPAVSQAQVEFASLSFGKSLASLGSRYVLIPVADDVSNPPELVGKHYEFSFFLFDTETGELIWEGSSFGRSVGKSLDALHDGNGLPKRKKLMK